MQSIRQRKLLKEQGDKVAGNQKTDVESKITEIQTAVNGEDTNRINQLVQELQQLLEPVAQAAAQAAQTGQTPSNGGSAEAGEQKHDDTQEGEVIDGEFTEN